MTNQKSNREKLLTDRRSLLQRLYVVEDKLNIPRSVVPKKLREPWKMFLEAYRAVKLDDYPPEESEDK